MGLNNGKRAILSENRKTEEKGREKTIMSEADPDREPKNVTQGEGGFMGTVNWRKDLDQALDEARSSDKPVFLDVFNPE
jgi:thiamine pyrophosphate-dependent acetolactate synthase large subunit-like protein